MVVRTGGALVHEGNLNDAICWIVYICNARQGSSTEPDIQLLVAGDASEKGSSAASDSRDGGRGPGSVVAAIRGDVCNHRAAVDSSRETAAGPVAPGAVLDPC